MKTLHLLFYLLFGTYAAFAQLSMDVIGSDLRGPIGIELDGDGNLWIAESGSGQNDGAVTVIWADGTQERVLDNLPSLFDTATMENLGPDRVQHFNNQYFGVIMSEGIPEVGGSIWVFEIDSIIPGNSPLDLTDATNVINMESRVKKLGFVESHGFSFVHDGCDLYIADAAADAILHRDGLTGVINIFATLPKLPNPLPFGPPISDAVPTRIIKNPDGGFYVSQLTGFPFIDGASKIYSITEEGQVSAIDSGLTLITDLALAPDGDGLIALQFANFRGDSMPPFVIGSAQIIRLRTDGSKDTLVGGFGPSASMAVGDANTFYVTNLFFGTVMKISGTTTSSQSVHRDAQLNMSVYPNPITETFNMSWYQPMAGEVNLKVISLDGKLITQKKLGRFAAGNQVASYIVGLEDINSQVLIVELTSNSMHYSSLIVTAK